MTNTGAGAAASQWAKRPSDERYDSLETMLESADLDKRSCARAIVPASLLRAVVDGQKIRINGRTKQAKLTDWSFGQLCTTAGAPKSYLQRLPADLAVPCLNHGLSHLDERTSREEHALYLRQHPENPEELTLRALTSKDYTRIHDAGIIRSLIGLQQSSPNWQLPNQWAKDFRGDGGKSGAYRGDRDMFCILTNGGSIVTDPTISLSTGSKDGRMFRGIIVRNSEVGAACVSVQTFLFRAICGNHIIWGFEQRSEFKKRHVGSGLGERFEYALRDALKFADIPASVDQERIAKLATLEIGKTEAEIVTALRGDYKMTETDALAAYRAAEQWEANPRSAWGLANGITRISQGRDYQDERLQLDLMAAQLIRRSLRVAAN